MMTPEDFIKTLRSQVNANRPYRTKEQRDNSIMKVIDSWREKETPQYQSFRDKPKTDVEYLAHMFAKAGVTKGRAYEFVKDTLGNTYDSDGECLKEEFDDEYDATEYESEWTNRVFKKLADWNR